MDESVYMVLDGAIANNLGNGGWIFDYGNVFIGSDAEDAKGRNERRAGSILYRCEPISADEEPAPEPRTVKAYVAFDPDRDVQKGLWAHKSEELAREMNPGYPIFEIEMREVSPTKPKRETGWIVRGPRGLVFGTYGSRGCAPCFFSESTAKELASSPYYSEGSAVAVEVYRDTLEPVDAE